MATSVSDQAMRDGVTALQTAFKSVSDRLEQLENNIVKIAGDPDNGQWQGGAAAAYKVARDKWSGDAQDMADVIKQIGSKVEAININYADNDRRVSQLYDA